MQRLRRMAYVALITIGVGYLALAGFFFSVQRKMVFQPGAPRAVNVAGAKLLELGDVRALWLAGDPDKPVVLHFHGNAEQLADLGELANAFHFRGVGFLAVEYPGYGAAPGAPTEAGIIEAAKLASAFLRDTLKVPPERTICLGRSLGTGVATQMAALGACSKLVLVSPYTSISDVAAQVVPFLPARWMVRDRFDSLARAPNVHVPVLVLHGRDDAVIPFAMGRALASAFPHATFVELPGGHDDALEQRAAWDALIPFVLGK